MLGYVGLG